MTARATNLSAIATNVSAIATNIVETATNVIETEINVVETATNSYLEGSSVVCDSQTNRFFFNLLFELLNLICEDKNHRINIEFVYKKIDFIFFCIFDKR